MTWVEIVYEVDDGYVGGSRPQTVELYVDEVEGMSRAEFEDHVYELAYEDMLGYVGVFFRNDLDSAFDAVQDLLREEE